MTITLRQLSKEELGNILTSDLFFTHGFKVAAGAVAPIHVFQRSKLQIEEGKAERWVMPFFIASESTGMIVGTCGFKDAPQNNIVEIGYNVSPIFQRHGFATKAVLALVQRAKGVTVMANISSENLASLKVVKKSNFKFSGLIKNSDNESFEQWSITE
ncbi:MAG: GNAT family protein [Pseudomonadota bacterium]